MAFWINRVLTIKAFYSMSKKNIIKPPHPQFRGASPPPNLEGSAV